LQWRLGLPSQVLAFDVNETLLDLKGLDTHFSSVFGDASLRPLWFQTMLQLSFVGGLTGQYVDFTTAQHAALKMTAERAGHVLTAGLMLVAKAWRNPGNDDWPRRRPQEVRLEHALTFIRASLRESSAR
jgi:hypothetical protein